MSLMIKSLSVSGTESKWIKVGTLLNGIDRPVKDAHIVFDSISIKYSGQKSPPKSLVPDGQSTPDLDLPEYTLLPGLIEAHAHLFLEGAELDFQKRKDFLQQSSDELLEKAKERLQKLVSLGIIAYRDAGDKNGVGLALSKIYQNGKRSIMPYVDSPGAAIHHLGRYGSFMAEPIENHDSLKDVVRERVKKGADRIKLIPTGIINFKSACVTKEPQMTVDEVSKLVEVSKELGRQTFAHASGDDGIDLVIEGNADSVEHGFFIRDDQLSRMRDKQIAWVPTFTPVQKQVDHAAEMGWDDTIKCNLQKILDGHAKSLCKAFEMGVLVIGGSDAGSVGVAHGIGFYDELELMEKAGVDPVSVINSATGVSSKRLDFKEKFGIIEKGYKSRFILTKNSPVETVKNLRKEKFVCFDGQVFQSDEKFDSSGL